MATDSTDKKEVELSEAISSKDDTLESKTTKPKAAKSITQEIQSIKKELRRISMRQTETHRELRIIKAALIAMCLVVAMYFIFCFVTLNTVNTKHEEVLQELQALNIKYEHSISLFNSMQKEMVEMNNIGMQEIDECAYNSNQDEDEMIMDPHQYKQPKSDDIIKKVT